MGCAVNTKHFLVSTLGDNRPESNGLLCFENKKKKDDYSETISQSLVWLPSIAFMIGSMMDNK